MISYIPTHSHTQKKKGQKVFWLLYFVYNTSLVNRGWWGFFAVYVGAAKTYQKDSLWNWNFLCNTGKKYCTGNSSAGYPQITPVSLGIGLYCRENHVSVIILLQSLHPLLCFRRWTVWYFCDEVVCPFVTLLSQLGDVVKLGCRCLGSHGREVYWELIWAILSAADINMLNSCKPDCPWRFPPPMKQYLTGLQRFTVVPLEVRFQ